MSESCVIAIDGPAASGKSTVGRAVAERLGYFYFDTGLLYRAATWKALHNGVPLDDQQALARMVGSMDIDIGPPTVNDGRLADVRVDGRDLSWQVRTPEVDRHVSQVAAHSVVRAALLDAQRRVGRSRATVMAGRDIGTVMFPDARLKIFLTASRRERARRRYSERGYTAGEETLEDALEAIDARDEYDTSREVAPLRQAPDAIEIDSDSMSVEEVVRRVVALAGAQSCTCR